MAAVWWTWGGMKGLDALLQAFFVIRGVFLRSWSDLLLPGVRFLNARCGSGVGEAGLRLRSGAFAPDCPFAVSYTHLDVYKRQRTDTG